MLWKTLQFKNTLRLVPRGHICHTVSSKSKSCTPQAVHAHVSINKHHGAGMPCLLCMQAAGIGTAVFPRRAQPSLLGSCRHRRVSLCPGWLGRAGVLASGSRSGAGSALGVRRQPGEGSSPWDSTAASCCLSATAQARPRLPFKR